MALFCNNGRHALSLSLFFVRRTTALTVLSSAGTRPHSVRPPLGWGWGGAPVSEARRQRCRTRAVLPTFSPTPTDLNLSEDVPPFSSKVQLCGFEHFPAFPLLNRRSHFKFPGCFALSDALEDVLFQRLSGHVTARLLHFSVDDFF